MFGLTTIARLREAERRRDEASQRLAERCIEHLRYAIAAERRITKLKREKHLLAEQVLDTRHAAAAGREVQR